MSYYQYASLTRLNLDHVPAGWGGLARLSLFELVLLMPLLIRYIDFCVLFRCLSVLVLACGTTAQIRGSKRLGLLDACGYSVRVLVCRQFGSLPGGLSFRAVVLWACELLLYPWDWFYRLLVVWAVTRTRSVPAWWRYLPGSGLRRHQTKPNQTACYY